MSLIDLASLVLAPTATKEGKVYSAIPDTGEGDMTFTRGSSATRVNSEGLIEKERGNLLLQSNSFNTTWTKSVSITATSGQSGYDGSSDAWLLKRSDAAARYIQQSVSFSGVNTFSFYAKAESEDWVYWRSSSGDTYGYINVSDGTIGANVGGLVVAQKATSVGNGFYRVEAVVNATLTYLRIYPAVGDGIIVGGVTDAGIYIQDAQLEQGLVATDYIETTTTAVYEGITDDVPRVDYSGGGCPSLLLESQRTNLIHYSTPSVFVSSATNNKWVVGTLGTTGEVNQTTGIDGYTSATQYKNVNSAPSDYMYYKELAVTSGSTYTVSGYVKLGTATNACIVVNNSAAWDSVTNGAISLTASEGYDEWKRFEITFVAPSTNKINIHIGYHQESGLTAQSTGTLFVDGFQLEAGSYSTSLIPTYGTSTTRVADSCSKTGISELIGQTEGTMFCDFVFNGNPSSVDYNIMILGAIGSDYITIGGYNKSLYARVFDSTLQGTINALTMVVGTRYKVAVGYANNDVVMYVNGVNEGIDTSVSIPTLSQTSFSRPSFEAKTDIKQAILFPTRLTNDELQELTK